MSRYVNALKILRVLLILVGLTALGVFVFLKTFNADRYRPMVINRLQNVLGRPVQLERLSLGWQRGLAVELHGVAILSEDSQRGQALLTVQTLRVSLRLLPLLKRQLQLAAVTVVQPRVEFRRRADGGLRVGDVSLQPGQGAVDSVSSGGASALPLVISSFSIQDGTLRFLDEHASPPVDFTIQRLDLTVRNFSLQAPFDVSLRAAVFSDASNLAFSGRVNLSHGAQAATVEGARLTVDLDGMDVARLAQVAPSLASLELHPPLGGRLTATIDRLPLSPEGFNTLRASVRLERGRLQLAALASPLEMVALEATLRPGHLEVGSLSANIAHGTISGSGVWQEASPQLRMKLTAERLQVASLLAPASPQDPQLHGVLTASLNGTSQSRTRSLSMFSGLGVIRLEEGRIINLNVLREVFRRLSILPGLAERLMERLPESSRAKLEEPDTILEPIEWPVTIDRERVVFPSLRLATDTFELVGPGSVGFDRSLSSQLILKITPDLSSAMVKSVAELQHLINAQGQLELPISMHGQLPRVAVVPDIQYVASRLLVTKTEELLGTLLQKALGTEQQESQEATSPQ